MRLAMDVRDLPTSSEAGAYAEFLSVYPSYKDTMGIDTLRQKEYGHLDADGPVCLDYAGVGLFSSAQKSADLYGGFGIGLSHTTANLATHAMYMDGGSTESFFRERILKYLNLDEDNYYIVFTVNAFSAYKLLGHSYPFHEAQSLLLAYDHECENLEALGECALSKGGLVQSASLSNPWVKIDHNDLRKKLQGKKKASAQKVSGKGLFAYPYTSRVTGCKNSSHWISEAQQNGWHVLLDVTSVDAKFSDSLGLALFSPDFLIGSFYYLFGEDPTGFGCLVIKRSVLRILGDSSRARAIGMVKIVTRHNSPSSPDESPPGPVMDPHMRGSLRHRRTRSIHGFSFLADSSADSTTSIENRGVQEDTSISKKKVTEGASIQMNVSGLVRAHADVRKLAELATSTDNGDESGRENCALNPSWIAHDSEAGGLESEAVVTSKLISKPPRSRSKIPQASMDIRFACRGLDHADMVGYKGVATRLRALAYWLVSSLASLRHPLPSNVQLVRIYTQMSVADQGSIVAFTVVDSTGRVLPPKRVQVLADRSSISVRTGTIAGTLSSEMSDTEDEPRDIGCVELSPYKWRARGEASLSVHLPVVYVSLGFLNNFSDVYKLWVFISRFLDPDFVTKELWHYHALNQETIEI